MSAISARSGHGRQAWPTGGIRDEARHRRVVGEVLPPCVAVISGCVSSFIDSALK
jgi:hypothetical protein